MSPSCIPIHRIGRNVPIGSASSHGKHCPLRRLSKIARNDCTFTNVQRHHAPEIDFFDRRSSEGLPNEAIYFIQKERSCKRPVKLYPREHNTGELMRSRAVNVNAQNLRGPTLRKKPLTDPHGGVFTRTKSARVSVNDIDRRRSGRRYCADPH